MGDSPGRRRVQRPLLAVAVAVAVAVTVLAWGPAPANAQGAWTAVVTPSAAGGTALDGVACNGPTCVAVGGPCAEGACAGFVTGEVLYSGDDGTTWNVATVPATVGDLTRVSCANPADCLAVGEVATGATSAAAVIYTTDFGAKWQLEVAPGRSLSGVACPAYSECFVDGTSKTGAALLLRSPTFGATWVREHVPAGVAALGSLTCSTTSDCTAFGASGVGRANLSVVTTNAGVTWRLGHLPAAFRSVTGEGCLTALRCMVSGQSATGRVGLVATSVNGGVTWGALTRMTGSLVISGVSCTSATSCVAVGTSSSPAPSPIVFATTTRGSRWLSQPLAPTTSNLNGGVSCESSDVCVAVGQSFANTSSPATTDGPFVLVG